MAEKNQVEAAFNDAKGNKGEVAINEAIKNEREVENKEDKNNEGEEANNVAKHNESEVGNYEVKNNEGEVGNNETKNNEADVGNNEAQNNEGEVRSNEAEINEGEVENNEAEINEGEVENNEAETNDDQLRKLQIWAKTNRGLAANNGDENNQSESDELHFPEIYERRVRIARSGPGIPKIRNAWKHFKNFGRLCTNVALTVLITNGINYGAEKIVGSTNDQRNRQQDYKQNIESVMKAESTKCHEVFEWIKRNKTLTLKLGDKDESVGSLFKDLKPEWPEIDATEPWTKNKDGKLEWNIKTANDIKLFLNYSEACLAYLEEIKTTAKKLSTACPELQHVPLTNQEIQKMKLGLDLVKQMPFT